MTPVVAIFLGSGLFLSLPYWLPSLIIRLRMYLFARINGKEGIPLPSEELGADEFRTLYAHRASRGRSRGAALSDLFWYWLSPGPEMHQEHLEDGPRYEAISRLTHRILAVPGPRIDALAERCARRHLDPAPMRDLERVRLRDAVMPVWADFYYRLVFHEDCPPDVRALVVDHARNLADALKCTGLRRMSRRLPLTRHIRERLERGAFPHSFPPGFSPREQAFYLQGAFFTTGVVQSSDGTAHLLLAIARHPELQERLRRAGDDDAPWDGVMNEVLRLYPLFGISHRITTDDVHLAPDRVVPRGTVLCFNHPAYHRIGFDAPDEFRPERWERTDARSASFIPFGMPANRPCPAHRVAWRSVRGVARFAVREFELASSAVHDRSLPSRGPCLLRRRDRAPKTSRAPDDRLRLAWMRLRDRWEEVFRSFAQLALGTYMVWEARRLRPCERYFEQVSAAPARRTGPATCPWHDRRDEPERPAAPSRG